MTMSPEQLSTIPINARSNRSDRQRDARQRRSVQLLFIQALSLWAFGLASWRLIHISLDSPDNVAICNDKTCTTAEITATGASTLYAAAPALGQNRAVQKSVEPALGPLLITKSFFLSCRILTRPCVPNDKLHMHGRRHPSPVGCTSQSLRYFRAAMITLISGETLTADGPRSNDAVRHTPTPVHLMMIQTLTGMNPMHLSPIDISNVQATVI